MHGNQLFDVMRKLFIPLSILSITIILFSFIKPVNSSLQGQKKKAPENYQLYCAGCHGGNLDHFVNRKEWKYGSTPANIESIIAKGALDVGMPGFEATISHDEIRALGEYILAESKQRSIDQVASSFNVNKTFGTDIRFKLETLVTDLEIPWGIEFLPHDELLIAERNGNLSVFSKEKGLVKIEGLPEVSVGGQGGLMDLKLHPKHKENGWIYISYSYADETNKELRNTAIIRAKLANNKLQNVETIYKGSPAVKAHYHFGCRMEFDKQGYLYFSIGDRGNRDVFPQKLDNSNGKIHRLHDDGRIPKDNPFVGTEGAVGSIYSYGHRNPQGVAMHPVTGAIWTHEHGPRGGDEINIIKPGLNYGWPVISFGINYNGSTFTNDTAKAGMEQPLTYYVPSIAPCGMAFVTSNKYGDWQNSLLMGSLRFKYLERCIIKNNKVVEHERLLEGIGRVREVKMSPDGYIYIGVENPGRIIKLVPVTE